MADSSLMIKIDADIKGFTSKIKSIENETKNLESGLSKIAKTSGVAWGALIGTIGSTVYAYAESEKATNKLSQALANQGVYSKQLVQDYKDIAEAVQYKTGIDDDEIVMMMSKLQAYAGNAQITKELTTAVLDYSAATGTDATAAATQFGKAISGDTESLRGMKLQLTEGANEQQRMGEIIGQVSKKFAGQSEVIGMGLGSITIMRRAISDLMEEIGSRFAPSISEATRKITAFIIEIKNNKPLIDFIAEILKFVTLNVGVIAALASMGYGFIKLREAILITSIAFKTLSGSIGLIAGVTGIGAVIIGINLLVYNWEASVKWMTSTWKAFTNNIATLSSGLKLILTGIFFRSGDMIKAGIEEAKNAFVTGYEDFQTTKKEIEEKAKQDELTSDQQHFQNKKAIVDDYYRKQMESANTRYQENKALQESMNQATLDDEQINRLATEQNEAEYYQTKNETNLARQKQFLKDEQAMGKSMATIKQKINSQEVADFQAMNSQMIEMTNSKNATLKAIGKAAAISDITIRTAQSAMAVYSYWATVPFVGQAIGVAMAAAVIAFGAEKIRNVAAAAQGGIVPGKGNSDNTLMALTPGELVVPKQITPTFMDMMQNGGSISGSSGGSVNVVLTLKDNLMDFVEASIVERKNLNLSIQGA